MLLKSLIKRRCLSSCISPPWLLFVRSLLHKACMSYVWLSPEIVCSRYYFYEVTCKELQFENFEKYLTRLRWSIASSLCRIRRSNDRNRIETGKYCNIPTNERNCQKCDTGEIGYERHYIFSSPSFNTERYKYVVIHVEFCLLILEHIITYYNTFKRGNMDDTLCKCMGTSY